MRSISNRRSAFLRGPLRPSALTLFLFGCGAGEPPVVLYVSADEHVAREVVAAFEAQSGIDVEMVGDTEATKTAGLANRLRAERDNPQADVFWSSEIFMTIALAADAVLEPYRSPAADAAPPLPWRDPEGRWYGFAARARVIAWAPGRIEPDRLPRTWMDLTAPRWKGRIVMADPRFGTTGGHLAAMRQYWSALVGPAYYEAFLMGLADNEVRILPGGNAAVVRAVADGEADLGLTDTDDVWAAQAQGRNVAMIYPRHGLEDDTGGGTLLIPNTVGRVRGGPAPSYAAGALIDFLLSEEVERMLARSVAHNIALRAALPADFPRYEVPDPLRVDYVRAAAVREEAIATAMELLQRRSDEG